MVTRFETVFGARKPIIAMIHQGALPGVPLFDAEAGVPGLIKDAQADLEALQAAGVDAVMFGNDQDLTSVLREPLIYSPGQDIYLCADPDTLHIFDSQSKQRLH